MSEPKALNLREIDLGNDEAEYDVRLREYYLKTVYYDNAQSGKKTLIIGRKGAGKSAIFTLLQKSLPMKGIDVIPITPDQYAWSALRSYQEKGILPEQAHTNAWRLSLLAAVVTLLNQQNLIASNSRLKRLYKQLNASMSIEDKNWFLRMVERVKDIKLWQVGLGLKESPADTPIRIIDEIIAALRADWPANREFRILIDRLDDSWDTSSESRHIMVGILKASRDLNMRLPGMLTTGNVLKVAQI